MIILMVLMGFAATVVGFLIMADARSAVREIEAGISFLAATVAFGSAGVIDAVNKLAKAPPKAGG